MILNYYDGGTTMRRRLPLLPLLILAMLALAGCGSQAATGTSGTTVSGAQSGSGLNPLPSTFSLQNTNGQTVTEAVLKEHPYTMINVWSTTCGYCIKEMPDLQAAYAENPNPNMGLIGIATDYGNDDDVRQVVADKGVTYPVLITDRQFITDFLGQITAVPATLVVDQSGNVKSVTYGARSKDDFVALMKAYQ